MISSYISCSSRLRFRLYLTISGTVIVSLSSSSFKMHSSRVRVFQDMMEVLLSACFACVKYPCASVMPTVLSVRRLCSLLPQSTDFHGPVLPTLFHWGLVVYMY